MSCRPRQAAASSRTAPSRRTVLRGATGLAVAWLTPQAASADSQEDGSRARPVAGDYLVQVGDASLTPLAVAAVALGAAPVMAWPLDGGTRVVRSGSRLNRVLLVRLDPTQLSEATRARSAGGVVAFSAVCTHTGCEVGGFLADEQQLYCECHQSKFDPRDGARVTDGPAPRPLPALPLGVDAEGRLVVAAPFTSRPGFEQG
jgi:rieske iron-sulfur protein